MLYSFVCFACEMKNVCVLYACGRKIQKRVCDSAKECVRSFNACGTKIRRGSGTAQDNVFVASRSATHLVWG